MKMLSVFSLCAFWVLMYSFSDLPGTDRSLCAHLKHTQGEARLPSSVSQ